LTETTPVAAISDGTRPSQRHVISTLGEIASVAAAARFEGPILFIVGRVIELAEALGIRDRESGPSRAMGETRLA
jgi:siroheme synthase